MWIQTRYNARRLDDARLFYLLTYNALIDNDLWITDVLVYREVYTKQVLNLLYVMCVYVQLRVRCGSCVDTVDCNSGEKVDKTWQFVKQANRQISA